MVSSYIKKLRNPKWQKKRLEILERDSWRCQHCWNNENTLVVHHRLYIDHKEPWDYPNELLITMCEDCHKEETENRPNEEQKLLNILKEKFHHYDLDVLTAGFKKLQILDGSYMVAQAITSDLIDIDRQKFTLLRFYEKHEWPGQPDFSKE